MVIQQIEIKLYSDQLNGKVYAAGEGNSRGYSGGVNRKIKGPTLDIHISLGH